MIVQMLLKRVGGAELRHLAPVETVQAVLVHLVLAEISMEGQEVVGERVLEETVGMEHKE